MKKLTFLVGLIIILVVALLVAHSQDKRKATNPEESSTGQNQSASGTGIVYSFPLLNVNTGKFKMPQKGDPAEMAYQFFRAQ